MHSYKISSALLLLALGSGACADADNPTALADLEPTAEFLIEADEVETMHAVEIVARVRERGHELHLLKAQLQIVQPNGVERTVDLEEVASGYESHVRFYEPGEHHIHLLGRPEGHHLMAELGETEVHVERQHLVLEHQRFELEVSPAPAAEGAPAHIRILGWEIEPDGSLGHELEGLHVSGSLHYPDGRESEFEFAEVHHGEYEIEFFFPVAGLYELHFSAEAEGGDEHHADEGEHGEESVFELFVPSLSGTDTTSDDGGDDGHGH